MGGQNFSFFTPLDLDALSRLKLGSKLRKLFVGQGIVLEESCLRDYQVLRSLRNEDSEETNADRHMHFLTCIAIIICMSICASVCCRVCDTGLCIQCIW